MRKLGIILVIVLLLANVFLMHLIFLSYWKDYPSVVQSFVYKIKRPKVKIFVTYYKPYHIPSKRRMLVPIQVGRAVEHEPFMKGHLKHEDIVWFYKNMIGDDTGDNISAKNRTFDVLTAYYWVWKHYEEIGNPQYIGFFAHRKGLRFEAPFGLYDEDYGLSEKELVNILEKHGVATWMRRVFSNINGKEYPSSIYGEYKKFHNIDDLDKMMRIIEKKYPEMYKVANDVLYGQDPQGAWNYFVMKRELAFDYFEKLFDVMFELEKVLGDEINKRSLYQRRVYGFLAERFFAIWLRWQYQQGNVDPYNAEVVYY